MSPTPISALAQRLGEWARAAPTVRALFWFGGYGYGRLNPSSDLDAALLLHVSADITAMAEGLLTHLRAEGGSVEYSVFEPEERRLTTWVGEGLTRLDVVVGRTAAELAWLSDARDVPPPRLTSAWPVHDPDVVELLQRASLASGEADVRLRQERSEREIDKFLVAVEACSTARVKQDAYSFYFHYNLALGRLARVVQLNRVGYRHLYLPRGLLEVLSSDEQEAFRALSGTLDLHQARALVRALVDAFLAAVEEARTTLGVRRQASELGIFLERLQCRDVPPDQRLP